MTELVANLRAEARWIRAGHGHDDVAEPRDHHSDA